MGEEANMKRLELLAADRKAFIQPSVAVLSEVAWN